MRTLTYSCVVKTKSKTSDPDLIQAALDAALVPELPPEAVALAKLIANGTDVKTALVQLGLTPSKALKWTTHPNWLATVARERTPKKVVDDALSGLLPTALRVKKDVLSNEAVDLKLRNEVASEVISHFSVNDSTVLKRTMEVPLAEANLLVFVLQELQGKFQGGKVVNVIGQPQKPKTPSKPKKGAFHVPGKAG